MLSSVKLSEDHLNFGGNSYETFRVRQIFVALSMDLDVTKNEEKYLVEKRTENKSLKMIVAMQNMRVDNVALLRVHRISVYLK